MEIDYFLLLFILSEVFLVEGHITRVRYPALIPNSSLPTMKWDEQIATPSSNRTKGVHLIAPKTRMKHHISTREAAAIPNHHNQAGSLAVYSIPEPPLAEKKASKYWDPTIFYCTILILSSTVVTGCLLRNCLCPALKDDIKMCPCYCC